MFKAIREGDVSRVKALAMCPGTNLMLPSKPGWLAVHQAAWFGKETCLRMLLSGRFTYSKLQRTTEHTCNTVFGLSSSAWDDQQEDRTW